MVNISEAVDRGDVDELIGVVESLCLDGEWDGLEELARRCRAAIERGRQLWPAAAHADYRLALEAPGPWAAGAVGPGRGRFAPGPLAEVAASTHSWDELAPHLADPPLAAVVAQERVVRGEDLTGGERVPRGLVEVALAVQRWEPAYALATYHPDHGEFPHPPVAAGAPRPVATGGAALPEDDVSRALLELVAAWTTESSGKAAVAAVEGDAAGAAALVGAEELAELGAADALAVMGWCGASGGAHGRRRGAAAGRFGAWWVVAAAADLLDDWPLESGDLGDALGEMAFWSFEVRGRPTGWRLGLAVENVRSHRAWAVAARDDA